MTTPFGRNVRALRDIKGLSQSQLAQSIGLDRLTINRWETKDVSAPRSPDITERLKETYNLTDRDLFGFGDGLYSKAYGLTNIVKAVPVENYVSVLGNIAAGDPREAIEGLDESLWIPPEITEHDQDVYYVRVCGDSMNLTPYVDGTYAAISPNSPVMNGDIAAVKVNGEDVTLKVYKEHDGALYLEPRSDNPEHKRRIIDSSDPDAPYVRVLGKAVWPYYPPTF